jgi:hypothetical protein
MDTMSPPTPDPKKARDQFPPWDPNATPSADPNGFDKQREALDKARREAEKGFEKAHQDLERERERLRKEKGWQ